MTTPEVGQTGSEYSIQERLAVAVERLADVAERIDAKLTTVAEVEYARIGDTVIKDAGHGFASPEHQHEDCPGDEGGHCVCD